MGFACGCDDPPEFFEQKLTVARKEHTCCECGHTITPGQTYVRSVGKWEQGFDTFKTCERCDDLGQAFLDLGFCTSFGELFRDYAEWLSYSDPASMDFEDPKSGWSRGYAIRDKHKNWCPPTSVKRGDENV